MDNLKTKPIFIGIGLLTSLIILIPLGIFTLRHPAIRIWVSNILPQSKVITTKTYKVENKAPGVQISLLDNRYLDYVTASMNLFSFEKIVDPAVYYGVSPATLPRKTVSTIRFELVPVVDKPVGIVGAEGKQGVFIGKGTYHVEGDVLVIEVALDLNELNSPLAGQFALEDAYLRTALITMRYSAGFVNGNRADPGVIPAIVQDMKDYLYTGMLAWPIQIKRS
jgi:hypothetical protein